MNYSEILITALSIIITALVTWASERLIMLINSKVKNEKIKKILSESIKTLTNIVETSYVAYTNELKNKNIFDEENQKKALDTAVESAKAQLPKELEKYFIKNHTDYEEWLRLQIVQILYNKKI